MPRKRSYYEILGVPKTATPEEIKKRYREMVRTHHPDVSKNPSSDAHRAFVEIVEAYKALSDPVSRFEYDRSLEAAAAAERPGPAGRSQESASSARRPGTASSSSGRTTRQQARTAPDAGKLLSDAEMSFIRGRLKEAESLAQQVIRLDRRSARAYAILGDVHRAWDQVDQAIADYTYAIQLDPQNMDFQRRLDRLTRKERYKEDSRVSHGLSVEKEASLTLLINCIGWSGVAVLVFLSYTARPSNGLPRLTFPPLDQWTYKFLGLVIAASIIAGFLLASGRFIRPLDDVLILGSHHSGGLAMPAGMILVVASMILFYAGIALFVIVSVVQEHFSRSLSTVFIVAFIMVIGFALAYSEEGVQQVLLFGGNVSFLSMLAGWFLGDFFRGRW